MKVYFEHNHDGVNRGLVAAENLPAAAEALKTSMYQMRRMGWSYADEAEAAVALKRPGVALFRPIDARGEEYPWREKRWHRRLNASGWE